MDVLRSQDAFTLGVYEISAHERVLRRRGRPVAIAPKAADVLLVLVANRDRFVSKAELLDCVWPEADVNESNLTQSIYLLRGLFKKYGDAILIENVPKRGYRLVECTSTVRGFSVRTGSAAAAAAAAIVATAAFSFTAMHLTAAHEALSGAAQREYVLARTYQDGGTQADLQRSADLFARVIEMQPADAQAYAGLAEADTSLTFYVADSARRAQLAEDAQRLAARALQLDPASAQTQAALGAVDLALRHDPASAARYLSRAIRQQPGSLDALAWYGTALVSLGHPAQARTVFREAVALAPNTPGAVASLAWSEFLNGDYTAAAAFSSRELRAGRNREVSLVILANAYLGARDYSRARPVIGELARNHDAALQAEALSAQLDALCGRKPQALRRLRSLEKNLDPRRTGSWDAGAIAAAYAAAGERAHALRWLAAVPRWDRAEAASDPRFASLNAI